MINDSFPSILEEQPEATPVSVRIFPEQTDILFDHILSSLHDSCIQFFWKIAEFLKHTIELLEKIISQCTQEDFIAIHQKLISVARTLYNQNELPFIAWTLQMSMHSGVARYIQYCYAYAELKRSLQSPTFFYAPKLASPERNISEPAKNILANLDEVLSECKTAEFLVDKLPTPLPENVVGELVNVITLLEKIIKHNAIEISKLRDGQPSRLVLG